MFELFQRMRIDDSTVTDWIVKVLRERGKLSRAETESRRKTNERELQAVRQQQERLLDLRLLDEINSDTFQAKQAELKLQESRLRVEAEGQSRQESERGDLALRVFELSQRLQDKWIAADIPEKRTLLQIVCLNLQLDGVTLVPEIRKPFDMIAEGLLVQASRGDWI